MVRRLFEIYSTLYNYC